MKKMFLLVLVAASVWLTGGGCASDEGSREFIPGKGWVPS